jgi:crotonobetainyl-CoA:carnitine CoA-transferase CaiB-like acyl-CoA transferase
MMLGDLGAEVIKVERPGSGDDTRAWGPPWSEGREGRASTYFLSANRNKRSLTADLDAAEGRELVRRLAGGADVLVENFPAGALARRGLGYDELARLHPGLVYCSITGYGSQGAEAGRPGYDFAVQARAGWMAITGEPGGEPVKVGVAVVDVLAGHAAAIAVLAALRERDLSGRGQRVEVSLYDVALAGLVNVAQAALAGCEPRRHGNAHASIVPYDAFHAADGMLVVTVGNDEQFSRLCAVLGDSGLAADARFVGNEARVGHRRELLDALARHFRRRPAREWLRRLDEAGVPCAPVQSVPEALADPVCTTRGGTWQMAAPHFGTTRTVASPLRFSRTAAELRRPPPALGEHDADIRQRGWEA